MLKQEAPGRRLDPELPVPDGLMTVGLDGSYVRAAHTERFSKVIAGRSVVAFRRGEEDAVPPPKCFGFVQTYDLKPRRRLWELMKSQRVQENQQVVFLSDGGEDIRQVRAYLHPNSDHVIDWFYITMRLTVLQQQTKEFANARPEIGAELYRQPERVKPWLWHDNVEEARLTNLLTDLELIRNYAAPAEKLATGGQEFETYIRNNQASISNYGERYRQGDTISTAFVESMINHVVSQRFVKKQQLPSENADHGHEYRIRRSVSGVVPIVSSPRERGVPPRVPAALQETGGLDLEDRPRPHDTPNSEN